MDSVQLYTCLINEKKEAEMPISYKGKAYDFKDKLAYIKTRNGLRQQSEFDFDMSIGNTPSEGKIVLPGRYNMN
jgi:hypothetical protein